VFSTTSGADRGQQEGRRRGHPGDLADLLGQFPGVYRAEVRVKDGAVTLDGHVDDDDTLDDVTAFSRRSRGSGSSSTR